MQAQRAEADAQHEIERLRTDLAQRTADLERMTAHRNAALDARDITQRTLDGIDGVLSQRTAERDEARRMYCRAYTDLVVDPRLEELSLEDAAAIVADDLVWDCFEKKEVQT
jgi:recombinational DNA repair ATPase RecF